MNYFVLLCSGKGSRMNIDLPKQYLKVNDISIFAYSLKTLKEVRKVFKVIITAEPKFFSKIEEEAKKYFKEFKLIKGGKTREESVLNALNSIETYSNKDNVLIHDSARMFVSANIISTILNELKTNDSAIPYKDNHNALFDSINKKYIGTAGIFSIETPQGFKLGKLKEAFSKIKGSELANYSDDGKIFLNTFNDLHFVKNNEYNLKITTMDDIKEIEKHI